MCQREVRLIHSNHLMGYNQTWVPCHYSIARPQVVDGEYGLHIWMVAANIMNKQSQTGSKGWFSSLWVGVELTTPDHNKIILL
jgi:hypothetical protein